MKTCVKSIPEKIVEGRADFLCQFKIRQFDVINQIYWQIWWTCAERQVLYLEFSICLKKQINTVKFFFQPERLLVQAAVTDQTDHLLLHLPKDEAVFASACHELQARQDSSTVTREPNYAIRPLYPGFIICLHNLEKKICSYL